MYPILFRIPLPHWRLPYIGELHRSFPIYAYGVMLGLSLIVGWYISLSLAKTDGLPRETMANNYVFTAICAIVGARLLYIVTNLEEFHTWKDYLSIRSGGLVAYGGFLGGFAGSWYYCASRKIRLLAWADDAVPSLASGLMITRIGCYLFGCDFGKKLPESIATSHNFFARLLTKAGTFPEWHYDQVAGKWLKGDELRAAYMSADGKPSILEGAPAWVQHRETDPIVRQLGHSLPVHPTQIYESLCGLFLLGILFWARRGIKARERAGDLFFRGELFLVFTFSYGVLRFLLEILRDDAERGLYGPYVEPHIGYPAAIMALALAFVFGLSNIVVEKYRVLARCAAILVPLALFLVLKPTNRFEVVERVQFSTSQWIALLSGVAAAVYYRFGYERALLDPVAAADLGAGVPALLEAEAALDGGLGGSEQPESSEEDALDRSAAKDSALANPKVNDDVSQENDDSSPHPPDATKETDANAPPKALGRRAEVAHHPPHEVNEGGAANPIKEPEAST